MFDETREMMELFESVGHRRILISGIDVSKNKFTIAAVNGVKVSAISEDQTLEVELSHVKNSLKVRQFGVSSNEIEVEDGDILEAKYKRWYLMLLPLILVITFIMSVILLLPYKSTILPVHILFLITTFVIKGFDIKKINS